MKIIVAFLLTAALSSPAYATDCKELGDLAHVIMKYRQKGGELSNLIEKIGSDSAAIRTMILDAFSQPRYHSETVQQTAAVDFRNRYEAACYSSKSK